MRTEYLLGIALFLSCQPQSMNDLNNLNEKKEEEKEVVIEGIALNKHVFTVERGKTENLEVTFTPANVNSNFRKVVWYSSNTDVATVSHEGTVTGVGAGTTEIYAESFSSVYKDTCLVTVVVPVTTLSLNDAEKTLWESRTYELVANIEPKDTTDPVEWYSSDNDVVSVRDGLVMANSSGTATITVKAGAKIAECFITVKALPDGAVDLGLSVFWATCNVGASDPEENGDFFAWGEVEPYYTSLDPLIWKEGKTGYNWESYRWGYKDQEGVIDNKFQLDLEYDAAYYILGEGWKMPSEAQWTELMKQCDWTWETLNGVYGYWIESRANGNHLFLPSQALQLHYGVIGRTIIPEAYYWSSNLDFPFTDQARTLYLRCPYPGIPSFFTMGMRRCSGLLIRPVYTL